MAGATPQPIGPELAEYARAYGLTELTLGRLSLFGRRHPEAAPRVGEAFVAHVKGLGPDHPASRAHRDNPDYFQRTAMRLLSGKLDAEVMDRLRVRAAQLVDEDTMPPLLFGYTVAAGPAIHDLARALGYPAPVALELAVTISREATVYAMVSSNIFTEVALARVDRLEQVTGASAELAGLSRRLETIAYSGGHSALSGRVESALAALEEVASHASNIGGVVELIRSIAAQTNLLALNATIEAARAGQQGKGFAVVASEVKNLAHSTHQSLARIEELVTGMQSSVERASSSVSGVELSTEELRATAETMSHLSHQLHG